MSKVYLKDIAKNLNLSKTAVSLVLNNKGDENKISQETQRRIIAYAKEHNYVPNQLARSLSRGKSETIGLIVPNISDSFYAKIAGRIEERAKQMGYTVLFSSSNENPVKESWLIQAMQNRQVDGLIIASTQKNHDDIEMLKQIEFPFVLIDRHYPEIETNYVIVDNYGGIKSVTEHLFAMGRKRIGFITIVSDLEAMRQRLKGYQDTVEQGGSPQDQVFVECLAQDQYQQRMEGVIRTMVKSPNKVDALIFATHYLAHEGLRALKKLRVKIPEEVAVMSFSEMSAFDLVDPPISSVMLPMQEIGNAAVDILVDEMDGTHAVQAHEKRRILDTELLVRQSCGNTT
ncbi:LacI family DNA-binding transcriptional regulator [Aestuariivivens insulae]|uniref:LacI family DNA-binding transcriptional regulator n=1 Tax=Aestuariivivens insulae TaxID=1621988 RepID=UPI001F5968CD|nr:LacI family DNA-binding transcriptional regulator [Aestuariivivens insulae]